MRAGVQQQEREEGAGGRGRVSMPPACRPSPAGPAAVQRALGRTLSALAALCLAPRWRDVVRPALRARVGDGVDELVCYALGSVDDRNVPWQLALLLLLANELEVPVHRRLVYDPRHGPLDHAVLKCCGLTVLDVDENAERKVGARTLFFMPFAPYWLTDNVLRANWSQLNRIAVIGNPLRWVSDPDCYHEEEEQQENGDVAGRRQDFRGRAPCADALLSNGELEEIVLWDGDMRTWLTEQTAGGSEEDEEDDNDEKGRRDLSLHCLNATLATFRIRKSGAPQATPPRGKPLRQARSKL